MIKTVIFDLGRVIVPFDFYRVYTGLETLTGIPAADLYKARPTDLVNVFETGQMTPRDFAREYCDRLKIAVPYEKFCDLWCSIFFPETLVPEQLLRNIARNYRLVLLSNTNVIHFEMIQRTYPLLGHFHDMVLSYQAGVMKPSPLIYQRAIEAAECRADECFFTDDVAEYIKGAREQGINAVQFESAIQIEAELNRRGVVTLFE